MALTNNGIRVSLPSAKTPSGFTAPAVTVFADYEYKRTLTLSVDKATVENATKTTTLLNIINNVIVGLSKQIDDIVAAEYIATNTVDYWADLRSISSNFLPNNTSSFYNADAVAFLCEVDLYIKSV